ncbi:hypothetical protein GS571_05790 [Rhodococcus hoagii]|nr:hypothetical protein [Prescottella equi]
MNESRRSALKQYWGDTSYPQRIMELAEPVAEAIPGSLGKVNRWKNAVTNQRIGLAHGISQESNDILRMHSLNRSIWWMLTLRQLLKSEVPAETLAASVNNSERLAANRGLWRKHWPSIWASKQRPHASCSSVTHPPCFGPVRLTLPGE